MATFSLVLALSALHSVLPMAAATLLPRVLNDTVALYLDRMCYPLYSNFTRTSEASTFGVGNQFTSLVNSPFPCEQQLYHEWICQANGTREIDFLAEQECLCPSAYWDVRIGCDDCFRAHGYTDATPAEASSYVTSLSLAECTPSPPTQAFYKLFPAVNVTSADDAPSLTLGDDRFPSQTAVSNYWTATTPITPGEITGSATGRATVATSLVSMHGSFSFPSTAPDATATANTETGTGSAAAPSSSSSGSDGRNNFAAAVNVQVMGGLLGGVLSLVFCL